MASSNQNIKVLSATVKGSLHKAKDLPCQDYSKSCKKNNKLVAIVSDGAGSAKYSKIGAKIICDTLCDILVNSDMKNIRSDVLRAIEIARQKLIFHKNNKSKSIKDLVNFSATLVGAFYHNDKGIFFHIGDGAALAFKKGNYNNFTLSEPENGSFSCETYFYTMDDWKDSLRFTHFEQIDRIMLMTDGVTGFVFTNDFEQIHHNFLIPVVEFLEKEKRKTYAIKALKNTLNNDRAQKINSDDKTILWAEL